MDENSVQEASSPANTNSNSGRHISEDESSPQTEDVQTLKAEVAFLREQLDIIQGKARLEVGMYMDQLEMLKTGAGAWPLRDPAAFREMVRRFMHSIEHWCQSYARQGLPDTTGLSVLEKQAIVRSLEGYWVQDLEWDTLMKSLPYPFSLYMSEVLAQTILTKNIMDKFFVNPFWYLEEKEFHQQTSATNSVSCAQNLQHLYHRFLETNPLRASRWRRETVRLSNSVMIAQAPKLELGQQTKEYRTKAVSLLASTLLSDPFFRRLLKTVKSDEAKKRDNNLLEICEVADKIAISLGSSDGYCLYKTLASVGTTFDRRANETIAHNLHAVLEESDHARLAGRRIIGITRPAIILKLTTLMRDETILSEAELLVEHGDYTQEDFERDRPKPATESDEEDEKEED
ncbi:hypothetical protein ASPBRDRAFT_523597 [Aspergillus brasiliensis CBS 101740]|uniref:Uncharacterized protein n=1 Tax=Aspergillus brasiliensis (strain CBS 101740 / IMI 381727 / IBT 21946) TaxID=767769 RepID=A0A1L9UQK9_ASPBC|nr:hypothetical protein ASPBRDRAFT_523597 [Aspergillus brasiliensis CBS 101740]